MCARFLSHFVLLYIGRVHGPFFGCTVLGEVHPVSAHNISLISDTDYTVFIEDRHIHIKPSVISGRSEKSEDIQ